MASSKQRKSAEVRSRIEPELKERSTAVLAAVGLDLSGAIRLFLRQVVQVGGVPFDVRHPTALTAAAMQEARELPGRYDSAQELFDGLEAGTDKPETRRAATKGGLHKAVRKGLAKTESLGSQR
ncbi:type II toxin-antitoxin system RelB/DinJ family antitoxin [Hydrogenophaga sp.]|uniref:type II toxin-antitoxin system RelB/DinJ family antitoxin n=1 Tax=Hydrogenophaga sp. TaxID=1904254 RepID=UPI002FC5C5F7